MNRTVEQYHVGELAGMKDQHEELTKLELRLNHDLANLLPAGEEGVQKNEDLF